MCEDTLRMPYTGEHICDIVRALYTGKVIFSDGDMEVSPGVTVHCVGGHSRGLQVVRVKTQNGWLCLASDATHYYENFITRKPFPIVVDVEELHKYIKNNQLKDIHLQDLLSKLEWNIILPK